MNRLLRDPESGSRPAPIMPSRYRQQAGCGTSSTAAMVPATRARSNTCRTCYDATRRPLLVVMMVTMMMHGHVTGRIRATPLRSDSADQELLGIRKHVFPRTMKRLARKKQTSCPLDGGSTLSRTRLISPGGFEFVGRLDLPSSQSQRGGRDYASTSFLRAPQCLRRRTLSFFVRRVPTSVFRRSSCFLSLSLSFIHRCRSADSL